MAFSALPQQAGCNVCDELLLLANSDIDLYQLVLAALKYKQEEWVFANTEKLLQSPNLWQRGKGLMLIALSDGFSGSFKQTVVDANVSGSWLESPSAKMKDVFDRNQWGKYWYRTFLTVADEDEAFCAWLLFLKCIDGRCREWMRVLEIEYCISGTVAERRILYRKASHNEVKRAIEDREKEYTDRFLTIKMSSSSRDRILPFCCKRSARGAG